jgi:hypothetical protein
LASLVSSSESVADVEWFAVDDVVVGGRDIHHLVTNYRHDPVSNDDHDGSAHDDDDPVSNDDHFAAHDDYDGSAHDDYDGSAHDDDRSDDQSGLPNRNDG